MTQRKFTIIVIVTFLVLIIVASFDMATNQQEVFDPNLIDLVFSYDNNCDNPKVFTYKFGGQLKTLNFTEMQIHSSHWLFFDCKGNLLYDYNPRQNKQNKNKNTKLLRS